MNNPVISADFIERLKAIVGPKGYVEEVSNMAAYLEDQNPLFRGLTPLVLKPASTEEISEIVRLCNDARVGIVPQGGVIPVWWGAAFQMRQVMSWSYH